MRVVMPSAIILHIKMIPTLILYVQHTLCPLINRDELCGHKLQNRDTLHCKYRCFDYDSMPIAMNAGAEHMQASTPYY